MRDSWMGRSPSAPHPKWNTQTRPGRQSLGQGLFPSFLNALFLFIKTLPDRFALRSASATRHITPSTYDFSIQLTSELSPDSRHDSSTGEAAAVFRHRSATPIHLLFDATIRSTKTLRYYMRAGSAYMNPNTFLGRSPP
jgi:hypothetical protein